MEQSINRKVQDLEFAEDYGDVISIKNELQEKLSDVLEHLTNAMDPPISADDKDKEIKAAINLILSTDEAAIKKVNEAVDFFNS